MKWYSLQVSPQELRLYSTLQSGQAFRWVAVSPDTWMCVLQGHLISLKETPTEILYSFQSSQDADQERSDVLDILRNYFQLSTSLASLYREWSARDANFKKRSARFPGLRILRCVETTHAVRQDPVENTFSFICTSNNNIKRITSMVQNLCRHYGVYVGSHQGLDFYSFPTVESLSHPEVESHLRTLGFGYRAKYIAQTATLLHHHNQALGKCWLSHLRGQDYPAVRASLLSLSGVGPKVADCIALMSMDVPSALPVDTHVWQIALKDYQMIKKTQSKTLTEKTYQMIGDGFREIFGEYAGWAHSVLFAADLKHLEGYKVDIEVKQELKEKTEPEDLKIKEEMHVKKETARPRKKFKSEE